jgi:hypothetical protein
VTGVTELGADAGRDVPGGVIADGAEVRERATHIEGGIERHLGMRTVAAFSLVAATLVVRVLDRDAGGIGEDDVSEVGGCRGAPDRAREAGTDQPREVARVVEVSVGEDDGVYGARVDGERIPVSLGEFAFLVEAALDEHALAGCLEQEAGTGDVTGGAEEVKGGTASESGY